MIEKLYKSKLYPLVFQILSLLIFTFLVLGAINVTTSDPALVKQLRNTNLSNLIVWSYWWPVIVLTAVFFGRHWCSICPIEFLSAIANRIGLKRKVPKFMKSGWMITILYAFIAIVAIHTWGIHRYPNLMAYYLLSLMGLAVILSIIYEKRAFCSYLCPVGKLLGLYSLLSHFGIRVKNQVTCHSCKTKDCISKENQYKLVGRSCSSNLYPANITNNRTCILCTQCVKSCSNNNITLKRIKSSYQNFDSKKLLWSEIGMLMVLLGFVCYENLSSWETSNTIIRFIPSHLNKLIGSLAIPYGLFEALILFLLVPAIFMGFISFLLKVNGKTSWKQSLQKLAIHLLPLVAFGHVFKALLKTSSRIPYWQYALEQPDGLQYANLIFNKEIALNPLAWVNNLVLVLGILGLCYATYISVKKVSKTDSDKWILYITILFHLVIFLIGPISSFF
ncbi:hypothetical protein DF185_18710 [Marinifilum breve]|uniref:4Fe-4S ferredoxin-type domain-containing protein n=1 Tax=Marinifilum breve TaxID=2184082 RepID=A0A2V3ZWV7_9BACT|nr:4Fe-4S binding protein [Marinifilum breve]PXX97056.1 hypothetical protein DF185_18710 [Marinifilum breve]